MTNDEFENLIIQQKNKLYRFAFSILRNREETEDAVQDIVLKLWKMRMSLEINKNVESFCMNAIKNHCFDVLRKEKQRVIYQSTNSFTKSENTEIENIDLVEKVKQELHRLPTQQRIAIELKDFQGLEYEEISEITEQSINTIRANVSRGRKRLFEIFKEELKDAKG
ncbi:MAG: RNA polymerase sigma factor [Prolixibacteraceae bacterium]|jgi:RNA polymerase sigma factor (sigma-70 family)|nr:RNA polymerase sigma factor [Prolixibacteraceae bacterium]MBT6005009.1 RNA polymerase sigma factor [Prolixibacteraceae bacterium]MBT6764881.1 RNA polymerase sigma factor [Prolixibacteraceae bacterium]MBT6999039.1 RNA polymerase sigma factor [Prolixibacteraceae bacterium]MBT7394462.1 RNA polymerase sigma factor [Prolixibacteraceae bacterium]